MNQDSSILNIEVATSIGIAGSYQSNASGDSDQYGWTGMVNRYDDLVTLAFMVSWGEYGSITTWTGYCKEKDGKPTITTMWYLVRPYVEYDWERFVNNTSVFTPAP